MLVYDPVDARVLLFGGDAGGGIYLNDLWAFGFSGPAAGSWTHLTDLSGPGRRGMAMAYDAGRDLFVMVGGLKQGTVAVDPPGGTLYGSVEPATRETFTWDRSAWSAGPLSVEYNNGPIMDDVDFRVMGGPLNGTLGYHALSDELFLLAERSFPMLDLPFANYMYPRGGTSQFLGTNWSVNTGGIRPFDLLTPWRAFSYTRIQSAYDPARERLIVAAAGQTNTIEYTGTGWAGRDEGWNYPNGRGEFGYVPPRPHPALAHDTLRGCTVFFGGRASLLDPGDTWELVENPAVPFMISTNLSTTLREPCQGDTITLTGSASGVGPFRFRWLRDAQPLPLRTNDTLVLTNVTATESGDYTFEVRDSSGRRIISETTPVLVHVPPTITQQPPLRRVVPGESFSLDVVWTSTLPVTLQWRWNEQAIPGATSAAYTVASAVVADAGNYSVVLSTRCTTVTSADGRVLVGPVVVQHPFAATNESVGFSPVILSCIGDGVGALDGTYTTAGSPATHPNHLAPDSLTNPRPLTFSWRRDGVVLSAGSKYTISNTAVRSVLIVNNPDYEDEGMYHCVVTDICGPTYAQPSLETLLILRPLAPPYLTLLQNRGPDPVRDAGMVYDSRRQRTVLFGGQVYGVNPRAGNALVGLYYSDDTWEWDGKVWLKRNPVHHPPPTTEFGLVYDSQRGRTVMIGGFHYPPPNYTPGSQIMTSDVWEWDGNDWTQVVSGTASPSARTSPSLCYDDVRREVLMITANQFSPTPTDFRGAMNALWAWDGTNWYSRQTLPTNGVAPDAYAGNAFAFDRHRGKAVLFGPFFDAAYPVWEWDGANWARVLPPVELRVSQPRFAAPYYDPIRRRVGLPVISNNLSPGGSTSVNTVVFWNGAAFDRGDTFTIDEVSGASLSAFDSGPVGKWGGQSDMTCFDTARRCLVWLDEPASFAGGASFTREMHFSAKVKPVYQPIEVVYATNQTIQIRSISAGQRPLVYQWYKDGAPLFDDGHWNGAGTATLSISNATPDDAGLYTLRVTNVYNQQFTQNILVRVPDDGVSFAVQGSGLVLSWPGATGILETAPTVLGPWTTVYGSTPPYVVARDEGQQFYRVRYP